MLQNGKKNNFNETLQLIRAFTNCFNASQRNIHLNELNTIYHKLLQFNIFSIEISIYSFNSAIY